MAKTKLELELSKLIDKNSASDIEIMRRYLSLVDTYKKLDKSIEKNGVMISVKNGKQTFLKANPAVSEKVKVNAALIKLGEFFEKKRSEKTAEKGINLNELY
ncbi:P27 family phage terminase small subunit [Lactococcus raffinolactis]|uniref:P27 family phage terminase small subunit n=1 Tax=Pseudolactococcus raffinolactis TaxID=1366 RepID=UPI001436774C|nr:P27 family phage terminase small subunit [Lactococcus raffinolactis]QIW51214.1 terminase [Lactococcus raffinolactis]